MPCGAWPAPSRCLICRAAAATAAVPRRGLPFSMGTPGPARIRRWLADRAVSAELPPSLAEDLDRAFQGIGASRLVGAARSVQVE